MKRWKTLVVAALFLTLLGSAVAVYADSGDPFEENHSPNLGDPLGSEALPQPGRGHHPRRPRALRGEVTAVSATGLTVLTRLEMSVQVNVSDDTKIWLVETQAQGSLEDIEVGDHIFAQGRRAKDSADTDDVPAMDARRIVVAPRGDEVHGRVTAVENGVIALATRPPESPEGEVAEATVLTNDDTTFRLGRQEGSLDDVTVGKRLVAFGETQSDGSLLARLVYLHPAPPLRPGAGGQGGDQLPDLRFGSQPGEQPEELWGMVL